VNLSPGNLTRTDVSLLASYEKRLAAQRTSERFACLIDNLIYIDGLKKTARKISKKILVIWIPINSAINIILYST